MSILASFFVQPLFSAIDFNSWWHSIFATKKDIQQLIFERFREFTKKSYDILFQALYLEIQHLKSTLVA